MYKGGSVDWERWSGLSPRAIHDKEEVGEKREWAEDWNKQPVWRQNYRSQLQTTFQVKESDQPFQMLLIGQVKIRSERWILNLAM